MGRKRKSTQTIKTPTGIDIRQWSSGRCSLRIRFYYRGIQCNETLKLPPTPSHISYAHRLRCEILNAIERGTFSYADYFPNSKRISQFGHAPSDRTIAQMLREFLAQAKSTCEWSTYVSYQKVCDAHLLPVFGKIAIRDLKPAVIRQWIRGLKVTTKTVNNILIPLRAVIEQALNDEQLKSNPLDNVVISKLLNKQTSKSSFVIDPFNQHEIQAILDAAHHPQIMHLFQFAFFTGLRTSELIALEWEDIDWVNETVCVNKAIVKKKLKGPKTSAGIRKVMLLPPALKALKAQNAYRALHAKRIFLNPKTQQPWETDHQIRRIAWIHTLKKAGVRYRNPYQTRHTYASMMLSGGENIMWIAGQMGHVDTEMVMKTYGKWLPDNSAKQGYRPLNNWNEYICSPSPRSSQAG